LRYPVTAIYATYVINILPWLKLVSGLQTFGLANQVNYWWSVVVN